MNDQQKKYLIIIGAILIAVGSFTYGALTAPHATKPQPTTSTTMKPKAPTPKPTKEQLEQSLTNELPVITGVLTAAYPKITTDYIINKGQLFDDGQWFGVTLSYRGSDTLNRDTLRVLMQKKGGVWVLRTAPPQPLLSAKQLPDVPRDILKAINQPISLP